MGNKMIIVRVDKMAADRHTFTYEAERVSEETEHTYIPFCRRDRDVPEHAEGHSGR